VSAPRLISDSTLERTSLTTRSNQWRGRTNESEEQKERHYKAWLRATLQKFADDVRKSQPLNKEEDPPR